ncbi:MAG: hypothetical protein AAF478_05390 [Pseudomonadota bacterium]
MNTLRKSGYWAAIICGVLAILCALYSLVIGSSDIWEFAIACCGAGLFFASAKAIIPRYPPAGETHDRLDVMGEMCASGFYALVLGTIAYMGLPYIQAIFQPSQTATSGISTMGSIVFFAGFAFSLIAHVASAISALSALSKGQTSAT